MRAVGLSVLFTYLFASPLALAARRSAPPAPTRLTNSERAQSLRRQLPMPKAALPALREKTKTVHHGSPVAGIQRLTAAENTTVGEGVYFTTQRTKAWGYARLRARHSGSSTPTVYTTRLRNLRVADLRGDAAIEDALHGFAHFLVDELETLPEDDITAMFTHNLVQDVIHRQFERPRGNALNPITRQDSDAFSRFLKSKGFDGLLALEGGEGYGAEDIGNHDSLVVFDPAKVGPLKAAPGPTASRR